MKQKSSNMIPYFLFQRLSKQALFSGHDVFLENNNKFKNKKKNK